MKIVKSPPPLPTVPKQSTWHRKVMLCMAALGLTALSACGQKGPLVMPMANSATSISQHP